MYQDNGLISFHMTGVLDFVDSPIIKHVSGSCRFPGLNNNFCVIVTAEITRLISVSKQVGFSQ